MKCLVFIATLLLCFVAIDGQTDNADCPKPIQRFNATYWVGKWNLGIESTGAYLGHYYATSAIESDPRQLGKTRSYMSHFTLAYEYDIVSCWHKLPSEQIFHFYDGFPVEVLTIDKDTRKLNVFPLNKRTVLHHVPADTFLAVRIPRTTPRKYAFIGVTVGPAILLSDIVFASAEDIDLDVNKKFKELIQSLFCLV